MNKLSAKRFLTALLIILFTVSTGEAQVARKRVKNPEKALFGKALNTKEGKVKESRSVTKAKRKQDAVKKKQKSEYASSVKESRKRSIKIQKPEVQLRMKENQKNTDDNYRAKKKQMKANSRKAGKKYR